MQQNTVSVTPAWPSTLFLCDWAEHATHAPNIAPHINELASGYSEPIASSVAKSAKPAKGLIESPLNLFTTTKNESLLRLVN